MTDQAECCIACSEAFKTGDRVLPDLGGGFLHFDCCADSFCNLETGEPLPEGVEPEPLIWEDPQ